MSAPNVPRSRVVKGYRDLVVWQRAMDLVTATYRLTASFPRDEKYGLVQQLNKAAVSIPSNIAEGHGRDHLGDYLHHLSVANGSLMELETQLMIAGRLEYLSRDVEERILAHAAEVGRMLSGLVRALRKRR
jgi:four helix bundle protein